MFLKQYNYKPRSGSQSSQGAASPPPSTTEQPPAVSAAAAARRRSSAGQFAGLQGYKRSSEDERRSSFAEQAAKTGPLGQMWNNFTKGAK